MRLSPLGSVAEARRARTGPLRAEVVLDAFVVMPNHVHALLGTVPPIIDEPRRGTARRAPTRRFSRPESGTLATVVGAYKSAVTRRVNEQRSTPGAPVWQRGYHERVVRDEREAANIRRYIAENPLRWHLDRYHP